MIKNSTRKLLRNAAIRNNFGGAHDYDKICNTCKENYIAKAPNQLRCHKCKVIGYKAICKGCSSEFYSKYESTKFCKICQTHNMWNRGKTHSVERILKSKKTRKKWLNSKNGKKWRVEIGKINSKKMKQFNQTKQGKINIEKNSNLNSIRMKEKILNGKFTPNITNSFTHWAAIIRISGKNKKFRSSWEACFWFSNPGFEYESRECRVFSTKDDRVYIADFYDKKTNTVFEIKPRSFFIKQTKKIDALIQNCLENGYKFKWINEYNIMNYINPKIFSGENKKQLNKMYEGIGKQ